MYNERMRWRPPARPHPRDGRVRCIEDHESLERAQLPHRKPPSEQPAPIVSDQRRAARPGCVDQAGNVIEQLLVCFFAGGHCLLVGVPGLAKTLIISSLSEVLALNFRRIQFTPDLMPSDITGTDILVFDPEPGERTFRFARGPIFTHILLADEINRTPPKTQAALMEAMEELQVTSGGTKYTIEKPFFVLATQNPIEQEGTYPLPAAQLDRFTLKIDVTYPDVESEYLIGLRTTSWPPISLSPSLTSSLARTVPRAGHQLTAISPS